MLGGRARGVPRATEACLPGVAPVLGRVKGDPVEEATAVVVMVVVEAVVVEAMVAEVEVMVVEATVVGVVAVKA